MSAEPRVDAVVIRLAVLVGTLAVLAVLCALVFGPVQNRALSATLGANLRAHSGAPLPLDRSAPPP